MKKKYANCCGCYPCYPTNVNFSNLEFQTVNWLFFNAKLKLMKKNFFQNTCFREKLMCKDFRCSSRFVKISKSRHERLKWRMSRIWYCSFRISLKNLFPDEINKHMQELSAEFEDLFDPYLPVASKIKMKACSALGVSWMNVHEISI
jgi:hypothetical protein